MSSYESNRMLEATEGRNDTLAPIRVTPNDLVPVQHYDSSHVSQSMFSMITVLTIRLSYFTFDCYCKSHIKHFSYRHEHLLVNSKTPVQLHFHFSARPHVH
jgi:hypothetical protein